MIEDIPEKTPRLQEVPEVGHVEERPEISVIEENLRKINQSEKEEREREKNIKKPPTLQ